LENLQFSKKKKKKTPAVLDGNAVQRGIFSPEDLSALVVLAPPLEYPL